MDILQREISNANHILVQLPCKPTKKVSKNSEKKHECTSQLTSSIYKISRSNSSYSSSYKKDNAPKFVFFVTVRVI